MKKPGYLSTYLLKVKEVTVEQLLAVEGVVEAALIEEDGNDEIVTHNRQHLGGPRLSGISRVRLMPWSR